MIIDFERVWYFLMQFLGYNFQLLPVILLLWAPFSDEQLKIRKKRLYPAVISTVVLFSLVFALIMASIYESFLFYTRGWLVGNVMFSLVWILGTAVYFGNFKKGTNGRILCYVMALQYGISIYTLSEIGVKFCRIDEMYGRRFTPYGTSAVLFYFICSLILMPVMYRFLTKYNFNMLSGENKRNILLISISSIILLVLYVVALMAELEIYDHARLFRVYVASSVWMVCMIASDFLAYFIYFSCLRIEKEKEQMHTQLTAFELQSQHMRDKIQEEKKSMHNMRHHFRTLISLSERQEYEKLQEYLRKYLEEWENVSSRLISRNPIIDSILGYYIAQAEEKGIQVQKNIEIKEHYPFDMMDLTVLLGNALENALEACSQCSSDTKSFIRIQMGQRKQTLLIKIENSCENRKNVSCYGDKIPKSSKPERMYGYGISSMQMIVINYLGSLEFWEDGEIFTVRMVLNIPDSDENQKVSGKG